MDAYDAFLVVAAIVGGLSVFFVLAAFVSDYVWPRLADRKPRRQAIYLR